MSPLEITFYYYSWVFGAVYSSYRLYIAGNNRNKFPYFEKEFVNGWWLLNRLKDEGDLEWLRWTNFICYFLPPFIILNYIGACIIKQISSKLLPLWYFIVTSFCLITRYGFSLYLMLLCQPLFFAISKTLFPNIWCYLCNSQFKNLFRAFRYLILIIKYLSRVERLRIWMCFCIIYYLFIYSGLMFFKMTYDDMYMLMPAMMWTYLRCLSFCMEEIDRKITWKKLYLFYGYVFHLPCFFMGPIILYDKFRRQIYHPRSMSIQKSVRFLLINNIRYFIWMFIMEFLLHFIYINYLMKTIREYTADEHSVWIMYGIGFNMGIFFFLKYYVIYGLAITWTRAEGYYTPNPPKCIATISLYSDMWRLFDEGLYLFIRKYIYFPIVNSIRSNLQYLHFPQNFSILMSKVVSSLFCFIFVYIWHGLEYWVFLWSMLNFLGILLETFAKEFSKTNFYSNIKSFMGIQNEPRFVGMICAPLTIVSAISNFYFLGGESVAETYFDYVFNSGLTSNTIYLWFFVYCLCQVSMDYKKRCQK